MLIFFYVVVVDFFWFVFFIENEYYVVFFNLGFNEIYIVIGVDILICRFLFFIKIREVVFGLYWMILDVFNFFFKRCEILVDNIDLICKVFDVWNGCDFGVVEKFLSVLVEGYGVVVFFFICLGFL